MTETNRDPRSDSVKFKTGRRAILLPINGRGDRSQEKRDLQPDRRERSDPFRSGVSLRTSDFIASLAEKLINQPDPFSSLLREVARFFDR